MKLNIDVRIVVNDMSCMRSLKNDVYKILENVIKYKTYELLLIVVNTYATI